MAHAGSPLVRGVYSAVGPCGHGRRLDPPPPSAYIRTPTCASSSWARPSSPSPPWRRWPGPATRCWPWWRSRIGRPGAARRSGRPATKAWAPGPRRPGAPAGEGARRHAGGRAGGARARRAGGDRLRPDPGARPAARWRRSAPSTSTPRCCRAGGGPRPSSGRWPPATPRPASPSCRWTRGSTPATCCWPGRSPSAPRRPPRRWRRGWRRWAARPSSRPCRCWRPGRWCRCGRPPAR